MFKRAAIALALSASSLSALAMAPADDSELSLAFGQDGVTIGGDLNINIGQFTWAPPAPSNDGAAVPPEAPAQPSPEKGVEMMPRVGQSPVVTAMLRLFKHQHQRIPGTLASAPVGSTDQPATSGASRSWRPILFRTVNALRNGG